MRLREAIKKYIAKGSGSEIPANKSLYDVLTDIEGSGFATGTDSLKILSDMLDTIRTELTFQHQADAALSQTDPVSGTKYTVLDTTENVRIIGMAIQCTWTVQPTPLEIHVTIDGQSLIFTRASPASETWYYANLRLSEVPITGFLGTVDMSITYGASFVLEGRSVKIEAESTGGTVSNLACRVKYAKR